MLKELHLKSVGPSPQFDVEFADKLNIFTGDNGLGKSFLLDVAWWVLTGNWVEQPAYPQRNTEEIVDQVLLLDVIAALGLQQLFGLIVLGLVAGS
jgi:predicted ATP-binding protein involved in virulence